MSPDKESQNIFEEILLGMRHLSIFRIKTFVLRGTAYMMSKWEPSLRCL